MSESPNINDPVINHRYRLKGKLGQGGMGAVYRAVDLLSGQQVAFKRVLSSATQQADDAGQTFGDLRLALAREFQMLASLRHPNVISVLDYGFDDEKQPFYTMALLSNPQEFLEAGHHQPLSVQVNLLAQFLQALSYLHRRGIIHRDLKPTNVLIENEDTVRVLDFGLATLAEQQTDEDMMVGTLAYMSPEVFQGMPVTHAADLYAVGIMAYELFVGHHPFDLTNVSRLMQDVMFTEPDMSPLEATVQLERAPERDESLPGERRDQLADVGEQLAAFLNKLLAKAPEDRYASADEAMRALLQATAQPIPLETEATRESFLQAARFVGREDEMARLTIALKQAQRGTGGAWLIGGESGVGKSRLLDELRTQALVQGTMVLRGQAVQDGGAPYAVWRNPLQRLVLSTELDATEAGVLKAITPDVDQLVGGAVIDPVPLDPQQAQERLIGVVISVLRRQRAPVLLILEDLHWASESHQIVQRVNALAASHPLLVVGSYRDDEMPELPDTLDTMTVIKLARLTKEDTTELASSMIGAAADDPEVINLLHQETEGNAFFLVEVVRALAEDAGALSEINRQMLPAQVFAGGINQVIERRIERVPAVARPLFEVAAVLGRELDTAVLQRVAQSREDIQIGLEGWLTLGANSAMLEVQDEIWRFAHDKLREGLLTNLTSTDRADRHEQAAHAIEVTYPDAPDQIAALAFHWGKAGNTSKERRYARLAGEQALATSAFADARHFLARALTLEQDPAQKRALHYQLGEVLRGLSLYAEAIDQYEQARDPADTKHNGLALLGLGLIKLDQGQHDAAIDNLKQALATLRTVDEKKHASYALYGLSRAHQYTGDLQRANQHAEQALAVSRSIDDRRGESLALFGLGANHLSLGAFEAAREYLSQARALDKQTGNRRGEGFASMYLGVASHLLGEGSAGVADVRQTLEIAVDIGDRRLESLATANLSTIHAELGDLEQAASDAARTIEIARMIGDRRTALLTLLNLAEFYTQLDQPDLALEKAHDARQIAVDLQDRYNEAWALGERGSAYIIAEDYTAATEALAQALEIALEVDSDALLCRLYTYQAQAQLLADAYESASQAAEHALAYPDAEMAYYPAVLRVVLARIQAEKPQAEQALDSALGKLDAAEASYTVHYMRGLAYAAGTLIEGPIKWNDNIEAATTAYQTAVAACAAAGVVQIARANLDALITTDDQFMLLSLKNYLDGVGGEID